MDKFKELTTGAKLVLGAAVVLFIVSWFNWFEIGSFSIDDMWGGIGVLAGLLLIALIVWQALRLTNINLEIGVTPSMITAALAILVLLFVAIRFLATPDLGGVSSGRTFWAWLGLALAIVLVAGAWMNMQATGESLADVRAKLGSLTASGDSEKTAPAPSETTAAAPPPPPASETTASAPPGEPEAPADETPAEGTDEQSSEDHTSKPV
jgi:hypothetical protein